MKKVTTKQWIKFFIVLALYLLFLLWAKSWLGLVVVPFIFDAYITKLIPWTFWKKWAPGTGRTIMSWVDAIVFALVAIYFVNIFVFQNYKIPSSSLEKSLLVGDHLFVSKLSYGPKIPNTPLSMPLTQNTLPFFNCKSYLEWPQWGYKRLAGLGQVKLNDIVVFNFPAGDTVALNFQATDYCGLAYSEGRRVLSNSVDMDSLTLEQQAIVYDLYYAAGSKLIKEHPEVYGKVITRPVDKRENYVKRCVGMPGDTLQVIDGKVFLNGKENPTPENAQMNYLVQTQGMPIPDGVFDELGVSIDDRVEATSETALWPVFQGLGLDKQDERGNLAPVYILPLTQKMLSDLQSRSKLVYRIVREANAYNGDLYPQNMTKDWDRDNYGPVWIPKKGTTIPLSLANLPLYERCITAYEGNTLRREGDKIFINGQPATEYTFQMDYYWMMGDNRHNSADSRYWGFVPEDHVVGKPILIWLSLDKDKGGLGGIRWNRFFKLVK